MPTEGGLSHTQLFQTVIKNQNNRRFRYTRKKLLARHCFDTSFPVTWQMNTKQFYKILDISIKYQYSTSHLIFHTNYNKPMISKLFNIAATHEKEEDFLFFWRKKIFKYFYTTVLSIAIIPYVLSSKLAVETSDWYKILFYTLIYFWGIATVFVKRIPFPVRAWSGMLCFYGLGILGLISTDLLGSSRLYLLCFSALAATFLSIKETVFTIILNIITMSIFCILYSKKILIFGHGLLPFISYQWITISVTFIFLCTVVSLSIAALIKALEVSGNRLSHLVANTSDVLWLSDNNLNITFINPVVESILGYHPKELTGKPFISLLKEADRFFFTSQINENFVYEDKISIIHKNGHSVHVELSGSKITNYTGEQSYYQGLIRDITKEISREKEQQRLKEKLEQSEKLKALGILAGSVAHDLNNTLSGIATYPEVLLIDKNLDPQMRQGLMLIKDSGQKASDVVSDLLTISRGAGAPKEILNLNDIIERYIRAHDFQTVRKTHEHVKIEVKTEPELLNIEGSYIHLEKLIMNLVINAVEEVSNKEDGIVLITTANDYIDPSNPGHENIKEGEYIVLRIEDNGSGIDNETIKKIFEPFFTRKVMGKSGTGLGLTVVWNTVQDHNGHISVLSGEQGTCFQILFPCIRQEIIKKQETASMDKITGQGETILIVDDLKEQQEIAITIIESLGYKAKAVSNGYEAADHIKSHPVDLIILDMIMEPSINGLETYKMIKQINPEQKAIISSGYSKSKDVKRAQDLGAGDFVKKPYTIYDLGAAIKKELEK